MKLFSPLYQLLHVLSFLLTSQLSSVAASSLAATYDMVWNDEFSSLRRTTWNVAVASSDAGVQTYDSANVNISSGDYGTLTAQRTSSGKYTSGQMDTYQKVHFQYCTLSARIKIPNSVAGLVPTFYTQGINYTQATWPSNGEINVMKVGQGEAIASGIGNERVVSGLHYTDEDGEVISQVGSRDCGTDVSSNFFVYTVEWRPENITTFYNDRPIWFMKIKDIEAFHQPHYMIFNLAVGGAFPSNTCADPAASSASGGVISGACDDAFSESDVTAPTPQSMLIDWVRIYDNGSGCQVSVLANDGVNIIQGDSQSQAPIDKETASSVPAPVDSNLGPASPSSPTFTVTAPSVDSPVGTNSSVKYTFPPNLSPVGTIDGSGGGAPAGSDSAPGGSGPTSTNDGSSPGDPPTSSVNAPGGPNTTPTLAPANPPVVPVTPAPIPMPVVPVTPPVPTPVAAVQIPVVNLPPLAPPEQPPSGFIVSAPTKCKKSKKTGPGVVAGDGANGKGAGKGENVFGDGTSGGKAEGSSGGKAEGAARYRRHQRRLPGSKETKRRRHLQVPPPPPNATSKATGVGADGVGLEDCAETDADALSVESGVVKHSMVLVWTVLVGMVGLSFLV